MATVYGLGWAATRPEVIEPARGSSHRPAQLRLAPLFFAFFMLDDPPTSAGPRRQQARYGAIVGAASFGLLPGARTLAFLPAGLLVGNVWVAARRSRMAAGATRDHVTDDSLS